ncbi:MAG: aromatic ring-hydroxylating dioxygenase subunit alpha [Pseudomonadota bacterium]
MRNMLAYRYTDKQVFGSEQRTLFRRYWQLFCHASQLENSGDYVSGDIAAMGVLAIRGSDGGLRAFLNVCRHRGARLLDPGTGNCDTLRCPYHNWLYQNTGELKHAPWFGEDKTFRTEDWPLHPINIKVWRNLVFIAIDPTTDLPDQLGATVNELADVPIEDYVLTETRQLVFDANWKIYTDNFVEGYHIPGIHPEFFRAIDFNKFETTAGDGLVRMTAPPRGDLFYQGRWLWMWPNWTLSLFDGGMNTSRINPLSASKTQLIYRFYFSDTSAKAETARRQTIEANIAVIEEDFAVCLATHHNYQTGLYEPGPLSPRHEQGVDYFQKRYCAEMPRHTN